jgi:hypothetical protein
LFSKWNKGLRLIFLIFGLVFVGIILCIRDINIMSRFTTTFFLTVICIFFLVPAQAQQSQNQLEDIVNDIRSNKITDITKYYDNIVPITMNNAQSTYSRSQAEMVLKDFFTKNTPIDLTILNSGTPNPTSKFAIGDLNTSNGKYSIYILLKTKDNTNYLLQELRLNKE